MIVSIKPNPHDWAAAIGIPLEAWPGRCNEIALKVLSKRLVDQNMTYNRYGHWHGPVSRRWFNWHDSPIQRHGWLELADGTIVDPTRWCFTGEEPYIYVGPNDNYDWGGDELRRASMTPWPSCDDEDPGRTDDPFHRLCKDNRVELTPLFVEEIVQRYGTDWFEMDDPDAPMGEPNSTLRTCQLFWLCNLPRRIWEQAADSRAVISYLVRDGHQAKFPVDTLQWAEGTQVAHKTTGRKP